MFQWTNDINSKQWKTFIAAFFGWTLDAMDLLLYVFAFKFIAQSFDITGTQAALLFSITLASSALGGIVFGIISDYVGRVKALTYSILNFEKILIHLLCNQSFHYHLTLEILNC